VRILRSSKSRRWSQPCGQTPTYDYERSLDEAAEWGKGLSTKALEFVACGVVKVDVDHTEIIGNDLLREAHLRAK
jgi:hypothetical protein